MPFILEGFSVDRHLPKTMASSGHLFEATETLMTWRLRDTEEPRVAVMLIILIASLFAVSFPMLSKRISFLRIPAIFFFIGKHFGTGVILATAFIHLLDDAFTSLADLRVVQTYGRIGRWTGAIILVSLLTIFLVEYVSTSYVEQLEEEPSAPSAPTHESEPQTPPISPLPRRIPPAQPKIRPALSEITPLLLGNPSPSLAQVAALRARTLPSRTRPRPSSFSSTHSYHSHHAQQHFQGPILDLPGIPVEVLSGSPRICRLSLHSRFGSELKLPEVDEEAEVEGDAEEGGEGDHAHAHIHELPVVGRQRQVVGLLVLQMGIMIHSFVIGLTLSVTSGADFTSLTTAIIFHQLFEGLSLGIRIAALPPAQMKPEATATGRRVRWLSPTLSVLFGITTPAGMALGMSVWKDYRGAESGVKEEAWMLLTQGIMSAVSAGMLIYAATVEMLAGDFVYGDVDGHHHHHHHPHAEEDEEEDEEEEEEDHVDEDEGEHQGARGGGHAGGPTGLAGQAEERNGEGAGAGASGTTREAQEKAQERASVGKRLLALLSLFAGSGMMVLIALGE